MSLDRAVDLIEEYEDDERTEMSYTALAAKTGVLADMILAPEDVSDKKELAVADVILAATGFGVSEGLDVEDAVERRLDEFEARLDGDMEAAMRARMGDEEFEQAQAAVMERMGTSDDDDQERSAFQ